MKPTLLLLAAALTAFIVAQSATPTFKALTVGINPYTVPTGGSNAVICVYKSTSLVKTNSPWKPTAYFPAGRTSTVIQVVAPGTYYFRVTAIVQPMGESTPSDTVTNQVSL